MLRKAALGFLLSIGLISLTPAADVQRESKTYRIGYLAVNNPTPFENTPQGCPTKGTAQWQALLDGLREQGYTPGQNLVMECRYTSAKEDRAPALAAELVSQQVDLLIAMSTPNVRAAKQATSTIPIVMMGVMDPVGRGLISSLARPGGNVTGVANDAGLEMVGKYLQLLKELSPRASRVAVLGYADAFEVLYQSPLQATASALEITLTPYGVAEPEKFEVAFTAMAKSRAQAIVVTSAPFMWTHRKRIVDLVARSRLPAVYPERDFAEAGGLLAYGADQLALRRRVGYYVDRIFKGTKPADIPVEQPTKFELVVNLKTAKALGITIPQSILTRADELIQ